VILLLLGFAALLITAYLAALNLALSRVSELALTEHLERSGRGAAAGWLMPRRQVLAQGVALLRTVGRMGFFAVVLAAVAGVGDDSALTVQDLVLSSAAAALPL